MNTNIVNLNHVCNIPEWLEKYENEYVGRACRKIPEDTDCKWGNPYKLNKQNTRKEVVDSFARYLYQTQELAQSVGVLRGKVLGCWCAPNLCHAEVLHQLAGNRPLYQAHRTDQIVKMKTFTIKDVGAISKEELIVLFGLNLANLRTKPPKLKPPPTKAVTMLRSAFPKVHNRN